MKYFIGFLITVGLIILAFFLVFKSLGNNTSSSKTQNSPAVVSSYAASDTQVRMRVEGKVISETEHTAYQITVGRSEVRLETFTGYNNQIKETLTYTNTQESYTNFLKALDYAGYMKGLANITDSQKDDRGACANGRRFIFEIVSGSSTKQRYWTSSCRNVTGTFRGNSDEVRRLFERQLPAKDYSKFVSSLNL